MASTRRTANHSVKERLRKEPYRFSFVQAVRMLEQIGSLQPLARLPVGNNALPGSECVHFASVASLSFPPTEVANVSGLEPTESTPNSGGTDGSSTADSNGTIEFEQAVSDSRETPSPAERQPPKLTVGFMGLFGPSGVLPHHDTQRIIDAGNKNNPERDFLNIFNHRILSFFYRASIKYRLPFSYESTYRRRTTQEDLVSRALYSLAGMGTAGLRSRLEILDELSIEFCGLLGHHPKNSTSLQFMLESYCQLPVRVEQFIGQWMNLSGSNTSQMPSRQLPLGQNCALGQTYILGDRVWDIAGKFRIRLGPLTRDQFESYLPEKANLIEVAQIARLYAGNQFDFDIQLVLRADEVPAIELGRSAQLGHNTWLVSKQPTENKTEAVFSCTGLPIASNSMTSAA